jgi:hypothetical protein
MPHALCPTPNHAAYWEELSVTFLCSGLEAVKPNMTDLAPKLLASISIEIVSSISSSS